MTHTFYKVALIAAIMATGFLATPAQAGSKERDFLKALLFPPIPVPVPGRSKPVDINKVFRESNIQIPIPPVPAPPRIVAPRVSVTVRSEHRHSYRQDSHRHHHDEEPPVHTCAALTFSTEAPPRYQQVSCTTMRPSRHHVWIEGYWQRTCCGWNWINGRWEVRPSYNATWIDGSWVRTRHGYRWIDGGWSTPRCY